MLKNILKILGVILIIIGGFPMIMKPISSITGNVINYSSIIFRMSSTTSIVIVITGAVFFLAGMIIRKG
ncbi:hypothetical protein GF386_02740 [Candidatus Pacearchaeota archaeon]|nr:hypothetical protein [Candidatus Pacearchaeota archaeon]MBD3283066.1 hypothetical protein [Candidatus Pacearchaeota archaeon]